MANIVCYDSDGQLLSHYTQWDVNQKLVIAGADISSAPDFHFLNTLQRDAYVVKSQISGNFLIASVPDELLQHDVPIIAHIYYVPGTTEYTIRIPVMPRRKPDNYIYTDTESGGGGSAGGQVYIANNLTTNDPDMALSAAQGVVIKNNIENLDRVKVSVDQMNTAIQDALVDFNIGSGVSGAMYVTISDGLCSKTAAEIYEAVSNGYAVFAIDRFGESILVCVASTPTSAVFTFTSFAGTQSDTLMYFNVTHVDDAGKITSEIRNITELIPYSSNAVGKYLKRESDGLVWSDLPIKQAVEDYMAEHGQDFGGNSDYPNWSHLKWYVMGDSLTDRNSDHAEKRYYDFVHETTGIQLIVDGIGGTGYGAGVSTGQSFLDRVINIPDDVDIVTIFGSGNDIRYQVDYNTPIYNALSWIALNRPGLRVIVAPPAPWKGYQKRGELWKAYCDRLQVCALACDFRYLADLWECPPFNPNFEGHMEKFFTTDPEGIHPNEAGHEALATYFYNALAQELEFDTGSGISGSGGNVELDTTLAQIGKAADAKAVGDAINGLRSYIDDEILGGAW